MNFKHNFSNELQLFTNAVHQFYEADSSDIIDSVCEIAFRAGLKAGQFWINHYHHFDLVESAVKNSKNPKQDFYHRSINGVCGLDDFDGLYVVQKYLGNVLGALSEITRSQLNYQRSTAELYMGISEDFDVSSIKLRDTLSRSEEKSLVSSFAGCCLTDLASFTCIERISPSEARNAIQKGHDLVEWLVAATFSQGVYVARHHNESQITGALAPVFSKYVDQGICTNLEAEFQDAMANVELFKFLDSISKEPLVFPTSEDMEAEIASRESVSNTDMDSMLDFTDSLLEKLLSDDYQEDMKKKESEYREKVLRLMDEHRATCGCYSQF